MHESEKKLLHASAQAHGIALDALAMERFATYAAKLEEQNKVHNLTAITDPAEVVRKHFVDSLLLLSWARPAANALLLDVGSGAGFPGVPVAIARPDLEVTLLESNGKKADFLLALGEALGLPLRVLRARAEDAAHAPDLRERFDVVTARAVAPLRVLIELCMPFAAVGGQFAALKGNLAATEAELMESKTAMRALSGGETRVLVPAAALPYGERCCVLIKKIAQSPLNFPRSYGIILKKNI